MWTNFEVFTEFVTRLLLFCVLFCFFFGQETCGILAPPPGRGLEPPLLEGKLLTTDPPGESLLFPSQQMLLSALLLLTDNILHYLLTLKSTSTSFQEFEKRCLCSTKSGDSGEEKRGNLVIFVENMEKIQDNGQTWNMILANHTVCVLSLFLISPLMFFTLG